MDNQNKKCRNRSKVLKAVRSKINSKLDDILADLDELNKLEKIEKEIKRDLNEND